MGKTISRLALVFCFSLVLLLPRAIFADGTHLKVIVNTVSGDGTFNFIERDASGYTAPEVDFDVTTQNKIGQYEFDLTVPSRWFYLTQSGLPNGWRQTGATCLGDQTGTDFTYNGDGTGNIYVSLGGGSDNIVCTITDQYSDDWLVIPDTTVKVIVDSANGDGIFNFVETDASGYTTSPVNFGIITQGSSTTSEGSGEYDITLPVQSRWFYLDQVDLPASWQQMSETCTGTRAGTNFSYENNGTGQIFVSLDGGNDNIICTIKDQRAVPTKTPVLFVPGLLGTNIKQGDDLLWANTKMTLPGDLDEFMNPLAFQSNLLPSENNMSLAGVIQEIDFYGVPLFDYTHGLIAEFQNQGYVVDEGASGQDFFTFPYDWRYGVSGVYPDGKTNSQLLADKIAQIQKQTGADKVDVIAHSLGGLIVKKYVMDCTSNKTDPKIGKLVFVGVPNLGSPVAAETLLKGYDFKIFGLNPDEIKTISKNMPAAYDLLPSKLYFGLDGSYLRANDTDAGLDYDQTNQMISPFVNTAALGGGVALHSYDFDTFKMPSSIDAYNIIGCKSATLRAMTYSTASDGTRIFQTDKFPVSGDDTVPFDSAAANSVPQGHAYYAIKPEHGQMPSQDGIRQTIVNIIAGTNLTYGSNVITQAQKDNDPLTCFLTGDLFEILSPVDITVTDGLGNKLGAVEGIGQQNDIPGASFEIENGHKYVYLPNGDGETYNISLKGDKSLQGTGGGTYTLIDEKIVSGQLAGAQIFKDQPVTSSYSASLDITGAATTIDVNGGSKIKSTFDIQGNALQDTLAPTTAATTNGLPGQAGFYHSDVAVNLTATDLAQSGVTPAGIASIFYTLDGSATTVVADTTTIKVSKEGSHTLTYFAQDKVGNREAAKTINFTIDKTAPEFQFSFDQNQMDLVFIPSDTLSGIGGKSDQNGSVIATDVAGNKTTLTFNEKNRSQSARAQLTGLSYNGGTSDMNGNQLAFAWFYGYKPAVPSTLSGLITLPTVPVTLPKSNTLTFLLQQAKLKDGSFIVALYGGKNTLILEYKNKKLSLKTVANLKILTFTTNKGAFGWSY